MLIRRILAFVLGFTIMWGVLGTQKALSMGGQFGTYTQAYLDRQKCKAEARDSMEEAFRLHDYGRNSKAQIDEAKRRCR
jgi:hypothetical protein